MAGAGIDRLAISGLYSAATLAAALALPALGVWADHTSSGRYLGTVLIGMAGAMALLATAQQVWAVAAGFFLLRLLGQGAIGIGTLTLAVRWFERRRGRALAIVASGYAVGEVIFPSAILALFGLVGWRGSLLVFGAAYGLFFAPLLLVFGRDPVAEETRLERLDRSGGENDVASLRLGEALRMPSFHVLAAILALPPLVATAVLFHQIALFESLGRPAAAAARALAGMGTGALVGTYLSGLWLERAPVRFGLAASLVALAAGLIVLAAAPMWALAPVVYGALLGLSAGGLKIAGSLVWPAYYGEAHVGSIKGMVSTIRNAATALGPPLAALIAGRSERFHDVLVPFAASALVGAVVVVFVRPPACDTRRDARPRTEPAHAA